MPPSSHQRGGMPPRASNLQQFPPFSTPDSAQGHAHSPYQPAHGLSQTINSRAYSHAQQHQHSQNSPHPQHHQLSNTETSQGHASSPYHPVYNTQQHHQQQQQHSSQGHGTHTQHHQQQQQQQQQQQHASHQGHQGHQGHQAHQSLQQHGHHVQNQQNQYQSHHAHSQGQHTQSHQVLQQQMPQQYVYPPAIQRNSDGALSQSPRPGLSNSSSQSLGRSRQSVSTHSPAQSQTTQAMQTPSSLTYQESRLSQLQNSQLQNSLQNSQSMHGNQLHGSQLQSNHQTLHPSQLQNNSQALQNSQSLQSSQSLNNQALSNQSMSSSALSNPPLSNQSLSNQSLSNQSLSNQSLNNQSLGNQSLNNQSLNNQSLQNTPTIQNNQSLQTSQALQNNNTPPQHTPHVHQNLSDDTLAERLRESLNSHQNMNNHHQPEIKQEKTRSSLSNDFQIPAVSSAPSQQATEQAYNSPMLQPEPTPAQNPQSRKRSADHPAESSATVAEGSSPAIKKSKTDESKTIFAVVVADIEPEKEGEHESRVQTVYCAGAYVTKQAANGAAWSHLLQGFSKSDFECEHAMVDGCSRIEVKGLRPPQEEPKTPELLAARARSTLVAHVTPINVPDVPLNISALKTDVVYIVTLMTDDGHFDHNQNVKRESNTEIIGVYHNVAMAKWHANATLTKLYGPQGRNAMSIDRKIADRNVTQLRMAIREGPETKIIEVVKKKVGGPMSNTWYSSGPPPNIHGSAAARGSSMSTRS